MSFNFPDSPSVDDTYTAGDRTWVWDGTVWKDQGTSLGVDNLTDVTITSPSDDQILKYATDEWVNADISSVLTDYDTSTEVNNKIAAVVDSAPETLDTLNELAAALGDDANFAASVTNSLAGKADASHTHAISDVTNLQTTLDEKAIYPSQTGNSGKFLTTNGTSVSWGSAGAPAGTLVLKSHSTMLIVHSAFTDNDYYGISLKGDRPSNTTNDVLFEVDFSATGRLSFFYNDSSYYSLNVGSQGTNNIPLARSGFVFRSNQSFYTYSAGGGGHRYFTGAEWGDPSTIWVQYNGADQSDYGEMALSYRIYEVIK